MEGNFTAKSFKIRYIHIKINDGTTLRTLMECNLNWNCSFTFIGDIHIANILWQLRRTLKTLNSLESLLLSPFRNACLFDNYTACYNYDHADWRISLDVYCWGWEGLLCQSDLSWCPTGYDCLYTSIYGCNMTYVCNIYMTNLMYFSLTHADMYVFNLFYTHTHKHIYKYIYIHMQYYICVCVLLCLDIEATARTCSKLSACHILNCLCNICKHSITVTLLVMDAGSLK